MADAPTPPPPDQNTEGAAAEMPSGVPVDGVTAAPLSGGDPTAATADTAGEPDPAMIAALEKKKKLLQTAIIGAAAFLAFYLIFGLVLMTLIPAPEGGRQGLKMIGMAFYGATAALATFGGGFVLMRIYQAAGGQLLPFHRRLFLLMGTLIVAVDAFAAATTVVIARPVALALEIISPSQTRNLVAPVSVTFSTERIRSVLAKGGIFPVSYRWDFEGDGKIDAEKKESEVTTLYKKKGIYSPTVHLVLSNGSVRRSSLSLLIPYAVFSYHPEIATTRQEITFSLAEILPKEELQEVKWDFNGDGIIDETTQQIEIAWTYESTASYRVRATVLLKNGTQETLERTVEVTDVPPGAFDLAITTEGGTEGTIPHGVIFDASVEEGIDVAEYTWTLPDKSKLYGKRVSKTFEEEGTHEILLTVVAKDGKAARRSVLITTWPALELPDFSLKATPEAQKDTISGPSPLEVKLEPGTKQPFITFAWQQEGATQIVKQETTYHAFYDREGEFPLALTARDERGRMRTWNYTVEVLPAPSRVVLNVTPPTGPAPLTVHFDASESVVPGKRITGFSWIYGDEEGRGRPEPQYLGSEVDHRYEKPGNYTVIVTVHTEDGEKYELKKTVIVRESVLDACIFPSRTSGSAPLGVKFYPHCSTGEIASYLWDFGDGSQSEDAEPSHVFEGGGTFDVKLKISDGKGKESETTVQITVE